MTGLFVCVTAGIPNLITADMIKEGAAVIDVGINRIFDPLTGKDKLVGDVDFEGKKQGIPIWHLWLIVSFDVHILGLDIRNCHRLRRTHLSPQV